LKIQGVIMDKHEMPEKKRRARIKVTKDGPYLVSGGVPLAEAIIVCDDAGFPVRWENGKKFPVRESCGLCRCGRSGNKPFCDGSHARPAFDGTETAGRKEFLDEAETYSGPKLIMKDVVKLCALARFCLRDGDAWTLTENSGDPKSRATAIEEIHACPSGRLVAFEKESGEPIEPSLEPSIGLVEGPGRKAAGPIWVKGGIPVESADGAEYEIRNRVTLCRCGLSSNKPFCDGAHSKKDRLVPGE
jgi:CDGSH-type Zn-finger protein